MPRCRASDSVLRAEDPATPVLHARARERSADESDTSTGDERREHPAKSFWWDKGESDLKQRGDEDCPEELAISMLSTFATIRDELASRDLAGDREKSERGTHHGDKAGSQPIALNKSEAHNLDDGEETRCNQRRRDHVRLRIAQLLVPVEQATIVRNQCRRSDQTAHHGKGVLQTHDKGDDNREFVVLAEERWGLERLVPWGQTRA
mmetsp:Transcript_20047/g.50031  ORF Transcript_20047/g.50031 Transcript_20047/m.50031 type:complete len:207 (-) Transcript_20047:169-789(-)